MDEILWHRRESRRQTEKTNLILESWESPVYSKNLGLKYFVLPVRRRHLIPGAVATVLVVLTVCLLCNRPTADAGLSAVLNRAGLPGLPESATNLTVVVDDRSTVNTYVRFIAKPNEIDSFVDGTTSKRARDRPITLGSVNWVRRGCPSWWIPKECKQGRVYYLEYRNGGGVIAVDDNSHTVYLNVWHTRRAWLRWLTKFLP